MALRPGLEWAPRFGRIRSLYEAADGGAGGYLLSHWRGAQPLAWAFWVNFVLLRAVIIGLEALALLPALSGFDHSRLAAVAFFLVAHVVIYAWQIVGVVRSCDRYQSRYGSIAVVWGVCFAIVLSLIFTLASAFSTFQLTFLDVGDRSLTSTLEQERASRYALTVSADGRSVSLSGTFELGLTEKLGALLRQHPDLRAIVLSSPGGNIFEGRGIAKLIRDRSLDTYVFETCYSACTTAFIAGATRSLGPNGKLGFHGYRLEAGYQVPFLDMEAEQNADRKLYEAQQIKPDFLDRIFKTPSSDLWFPSQEELLRAGVVHRIASSVR